MKKLHTILWKEDKWFIAKALEVEVASQGKTEEEALKNLKEALELYFEDQKEVARGTFISILNQANMNEKEFEKFVK